MRNPWEVFAETHPVGTEVEGEVKNITEFGLFIGLDGDIDGMVHLSDLDWDERGEEAIQNYRKGDMVKAHGARSRRREGAHLPRRSRRWAATRSPRPSTASSAARSSPSTVTKIEDGGIEVEYEGMKSFIRRSDLSATVPNSAPSASVSATRSTSASPTSTARRAVWACRSRRARSPKRRKRSSSTARPTRGASLGDILGAALKGDEKDEK